MSSGGSGGPGGIGFNKAGALLLAGLGGLAGLIILTGGGGGGNDSPNPNAVPTSQAQAVATSTPSADSAPVNPNVGSERDQLRGEDTNAVVVLVTAFGMPARVGIEAQDSSKVKSSGMYVAGNVNLGCLPDAQYPQPCVSYMVVERGTTVTVTAGDARAGFWPVFDSLSGGGCDREGGSGRDVSCEFEAFDDVQIVARYYGSDTPNGRYDYPKCPAVRETTATSEWIRRCQ